MIIFDRHRRARKNLSAYVDGELSARESEALDAHLEACERCRLELNALRATAGALRSLPEVEPHRSFALTPEMVAPPRPAPRAGPAPALAYGARMAAAGLAAALVIVFVIDVSDGGSGDSDAGGPMGLAESPGDEENVQGFDALGDGAAESTSVPETAAGDDQSGPAPTATPAPMSPHELGGAGGVGGAPDGAGSGTDSGGGEDGAAGPDSEGGDTTEQPSGDDEETRSGTEGVPTDGSTDDSAGPGEDAINDDADAAGAGEQATALSSEDDGGFDALLAAEIGLAAALAVVLAASVWLTIAGRRREIRP